MKGMLDSMIRVAATCALAGLLFGWPAGAGAQVRTQVVATGLVNPVAFVMDPVDHSTFYVVEQRGTIRTVRDNTVLPALFLDIRSVISAGGERGLLGLAFPPDACLVAAVVRQFHQPGRSHRRRAVYAYATRHRRSELAVRSGVAGRPALHRAAVLEPQRRPPRVRSRRLSLHRPRRRRQRRRSAQPARRIRTRCSARCCASTSTCPTHDARGYRVPEDNPFVDRQPIAALAGDLGVRPAQSLALQLRRLDARRHRRAGHRRRRPDRARRGELGADTRRRPQLRLAAARRPHAVRRAHAGGVSAADRADSRLPAQRRQSITGGFVYRGAALDPMFNGRYFFADYVAGRVFTIGLALDERQEARAVDLVGADGSCSAGPESWASSALSASTRMPSFTSSAIHGAEFSRSFLSESRAQTGSRVRKIHESTRETSGSRFPVLGSRYMRKVD